MGWMERRKRERDDELLSAYVDGQLLGRTRSDFEARLAREPELRARLEATRRMLGLVRSLPAVPAPRNFILDPARYGARSRRVARRLYPTLRLATALAAVILACAVSLDLATQVRLPSFGFGAAAPAPQSQPVVATAPQQSLAAAATTPAEPGETDGQRKAQATAPDALPPATQPTAPPMQPTQPPSAPGPTIPPLAVQRTTPSQEGAPPTPAAPSAHPAGHRRPDRAAGRQIRRWHRPRPPQALRSNGRLLRRRRRRPLQRRLPSHRRCRRLSL